MTSTATATNNITYKDIRNYVVSYLTEQVDQYTITISAHPGKPNEEEIQRMAQQTPSIIVSLTSIQKDGTGDTEKLSMVCWLLIGSRNNDKIHDQSLTLLSSIIPLLRHIDAPWSMGGAINLHAENLYSSSKNELNVASWSLRWEWNVRSAVASVIADGGIPGLTEASKFDGYNAAHEIGTKQIDDNVDL